MKQNRSVRRRRNPAPRRNPWIDQDLALNELLQEHGLPAGDENVVHQIALQLRAAGVKMEYDPSTRISFIPEDSIDVATSIVRRFGKFYAGVVAEAPAKTLQPVETTRPEADFDEDEEDDDDDAEDNGYPYYG